MGGESRPSNYWRSFFGSCGTNIVELIKQAIIVAASDNPDEFFTRRDEIAEALFACRLRRCAGCDCAKPREIDEVEEEDGSDGREEKESDVDRGCNEPTTRSQHEEPNRIVSKYSYDEAEALTDKMEEESEVVGEVLRIKNILENKHEESDGILFESLRRLQLLQLSVETLKASEIGRAVNGLRKHNSKSIRHLSRTLIDGWKALVDEWVKATQAIQGGTPDSFNPSTLDEDGEGLPFPPVDEAALFATQTTTIELSKIFDGMDEDGNPRSNGEVEKENKRKSQPEKNRGSRIEKPTCPQDKGESKGLAIARQPLGDNTSRQIKPQHVQRSKLVSQSGHGRPSTLTSEYRTSGTIPQHKQDHVGVQHKPLTVVQNELKHSDEASVRAKLEVAKRKLHEGYQQAESAKKQRTIQVMELQDIPKTGGGGSGNHRQPILKHGSNLRKWVNGRR